jgi:8-hydroxy-5-deazaflavin:NADPH oxidoreductase
MAAVVGGRIAKAGYTVEVVNRDPAKARVLAKKLAAGATTGTYGAVPYASAAAVAEPSVSSNNLVSVTAELPTPRDPTPKANALKSHATMPIHPKGSDPVREEGSKLCGTFLPESFAVWCVVVFLWPMTSWETILDRTA